MTTRRDFLKGAAAVAASTFVEPRESEAQAVRPRAPKLEDTVRRSRPGPDISTDPAAIQNPYELFRFLLIEGHTGEETNFARDYPSFVKGMATRLSFVPFERAVLYIPPASRITATIWPGHIFISDLVDATFVMAQESAKYDAYHSSKEELKLGVNLGKTYRLETKPKIKAVVRVAFENAEKNVDENGYFTQDIEFAKKAADEYGVNVNVQAHNLAERVVKKAIGNVEEYPYKHEIRVSLDGLKKLSETFGIDGGKYTGDFFEGVFKSASSDAALNKMEEARLKADFGKQLAKSYAPAYIPKFDALIGKLK